MNIRRSTHQKNTRIAMVPAPTSIPAATHAKKASSTRRSSMRRQQRSKRQKQEAAAKRQADETTTTPQPPRLATVPEALMPHKQPASPNTAATTLQMRVAAEVEARRKNTPPMDPTQRAIKHTTKLEMLRMLKVRWVTLRRAVWRVDQTINRSDQ
jgi:glutathione synthase/RimK-type ligase-like ATP-grasp enzyme